jgi:tRNA G18 (ribose-2'-O)-methylase SpoU
VTADEIHVEHPEDPRLRDYAHVGDPAWLAAHGLFVAEGRLVVKRLIDCANFRIASVLLSPAARESFGGEIETDAPVFVMRPEHLQRVTGFNFHRGCLALAHRPPSGAQPTFPGARRLLALEGVGNPDNVGGLFRVAAAFGVDGLLLDEASGDPFYRKAIRTSMGAVLTLPFARLEPWPSALGNFRSRGFSVVALTPRAEAQPLAEFARAASKPLVLMVGAEGPGLTPAALAEADVLVRIPIAPGVDSLNVTVAAGIALSHLPG